MANATTAQPGFTLITGTRIYDLHGGLLARGTIQFLPVSAPSGVTPGFRVGGPAPGQGIVRPYSFPISNGAIVSDGTVLVSGDTYPPQLPDTSLTSPPDIGFLVRIIDPNSGRNILGPGYIIQPTGASFDFDSYEPVNSSLSVTIQQGPPGPFGPPGLGYFVDSVTGQIYQLGVSSGLPVATLIGNGLVLQDTDTGVHFSLALSHGSVSVTAIGSAGTPSTIVLIDAVTALHYRLQVTDAAVTPVQVDASVAGVAAYPMLDIGTGVTANLGVVSGALQIT